MCVCACVLVNLNRCVLAFLPNLFNLCWYLPNSWMCAYVCVCVLLTCIIQMYICIHEYVCTMSPYTQILLQSLSICACPMCSTWALCTHRFTQRTTEREKRDPAAVESASIRDRQEGNSQEGCTHAHSCERDDARFCRRLPMSQVEKPPHLAVSRIRLLWRCSTSHVASASSSAPVGLHVLLLLRHAALELQVPYLSAHITSFSHCDTRYT